MSLPDHAVTVSMQSRAIVRCEFCEDADRLLRERHFHRPLGLLAEADLRQTRCCQDAGGRWHDHFAASDPVGDFGCVQRAAATGRDQHCVSRVDAAREGLATDCFSDQGFGHLHRSECRGRDIALVNRQAGHQRMCRRAAIKREIVAETIGQETSE